MSDIMAKNGNILTLSSGGILAYNCQWILPVPEKMIATYTMTTNPGRCHEDDYGGYYKFLSNEFVNPVTLLHTGSSGGVHSYCLESPFTPDTCVVNYGLLDWTETFCMEEGCGDCNPCTPYHMPYSSYYSMCDASEDVTGGITFTELYDSEGILNGVRVTILWIRILAWYESQYKGVVIYNVTDFSFIHKPVDGWWIGTYEQQAEYDGPNIDKRGYRWTNYDAWNITQVTLSEAPDI